jgi:hypothetical protein
MVTDNTLQKYQCDQNFIRLLSWEKKEVPFPTHSQAEVCISSATIALPGLALCCSSMVNL